MKIPGAGWRHGWLLVPIYARLTGKTNVEEREAFRAKLSDIRATGGNRCNLVMGGDFNGEVGPAKDKAWRHVMGPHGDNRGTLGGEELLQFCEQEGLAITKSHTQQKVSAKATCLHFKRGTPHLLDYFLVDKGDLRWIRHTKTIHLAQSQGNMPVAKSRRPQEFCSAPWLAHTDHDPVELRFQVSKDWREPRAAATGRMERPDVIRILGSSR